ncbi:preprotein translocase subunit SecY [Candidatus Woesearchaeota archaeon]|nr:preprotein translocase subunit SecY [Candidatus Woesearchaeota archaeon]
MSFLDKIIFSLPEVKGPKQRLSFKEKLKWTLLILVFFFVLGFIPLYGLGENALQQFEFLSIILGASFGSIISLGIGPLVTSSIVLQLLSGTGMLKLDLTTLEGKKKFQGLNKILGIFFVIFESAIYVLMGGLAPSNSLAGTSLYGQLEMLLIFQLFLGGIMIMFMDEVVSKWGFGSGISLFIAAGVSQQLFIRMFNFLPSPTNPDISAGAIPSFFQSIVGGDVTTAGLQLAGVLSTLLVFGISVYAQSMKVEIPLSFGRVRGQGIRWPLNFFYTSNIPVILMAALLANVQLFATLFERWGHPILGTFSGSSPASGAVYWLSAPNVVGSILRGAFTPSLLLQALVYTLALVIGAVVFSIFWVQTANMNAQSQARQILASGLQIPGFRRDERVLERVLDRYIWPLTIIGGAAIGLLAALADLTGALANGTSIVLTVSIIYKLYEEISKQHMMDMHPAMRKFME